MEHNNSLIAELKEKVALLEKTQYANKIGYWELCVESNKTVWSDMVYDIYELPRNIDTNKTQGLYFYHHDYQEIVSKAVENCIVNAEPFNIECKLITHKKNEKWVRATGRKVGDKLIGSFQDITDIKEQELKYKGIFNSSFTFIGFLDTNGILLEANDTAVNIAGIKHSDVIGKYFWDCYWWQISKQAQKELKVSFQKTLMGETVEYEVAVWIANKTPITILFTLKPIFDENGKVIYVIPEGRPVQELVDARRRYKSVLEGTNVGTWEWNVQTGETIFNERWADIVGYTLEELAPISIETWMNLAHPDDLEESGKRLTACFEKKSEFYEFEARMKHKDGHWVWVFDRGKVMDWSDDGRPLWMYGTHQDITERKQREEALRISEEAFRGNFENAAVGMAIISPSGQWLKVNRKVCEIVGYPAEELMQLTFQDITHPEDLDIDLGLLNELVEGKRDHYQMEKRYFHKNGHLVYIILAVSMVKDESGNVLNFISQIIDITPLKRTEMRLKSLLTENRALMDATTEVAFISTDKEGIIEDTNVGAEKLLGYTSDQVKALSIKDLLFLQKEWEEASKALVKNDSGKVETRELLYALANENKNREWSFKKADGSIMDGLVSVTVVFLEGKPTKYLFAATNISHIKSIQAQLKQKNEELEQFAYIAAHDMKEPLRGITTYLSILQKKYSDHLDEKATLYINNAYNNANRMKSLITDILDFSKTGEVGDQPVNLNNLLDSIINSYQGDNKINVNISRTEMPTLKGDASSFIQLFTNLIENGIKYQPKGQTPEIKVEVTESDKWWVFTVADNGIGIAPEHQNKVFEIFKRLHAESEYSGTGIGLAACKKIVTAYGGKIWFEPVEPKGTVFKFTVLK